MEDAMELGGARRSGKFMVAHGTYDALYLVSGDREVMMRLPDHPLELDHVSLGIPRDGWHVPDPEGCEECRLWARWL
jgi:hypothetical protein